MDSDATFPDRHFQMWEYRVSHGSLLIRSPKSPTVATNVDVVFKGVAYLACPRHLPGVALVPPTAADARRVADEFGRVAGTDQIFVLASAGARHLVVALTCHVSEHTDDIFTPLVI